MDEPKLDAAEIVRLGQVLDAREGSRALRDLAGLASGLSLDEDDIENTTENKTSPNLFESLSAPLSFDREPLVASLSQRPVSLSDLPVWSRVNHGLGPELNQALAGGLRKSSVIIIGANHAGAGKTAFVQQLVDGLALRSYEESGPLTPVLMFSEMTAEQLMLRSLARWTGISYSSLLDGSARFGADFESLLGAADELQSIGAFARVVTASVGRLRELAGRRSLAQLIASLVGEWSESLEQAHERPVWPIVVVDPIQRWQSHNKSEVEALNELSEELTEAARAQGFILIATSDTTKAAATSAVKGENPASVFRGTYKMLHAADVAMVLSVQDRTEAEEEMAPHLRKVAVELVKNRWGVSWPGSAGRVQFLWEPRCGRFTPLKRGDLAKRRKQSLLEVEL